SAEKVAAATAHHVVKNLLTDASLTEIVIVTSLSQHESRRKRELALVETMDEKKPKDPPHLEISRIKQGSEIKPHPDEKRYLHKSETNQVSRLEKRPKSAKRDAAAPSTSVLAVERSLANCSLEDLDKTELVPIKDLKAKKKIRQSPAQEEILSPFKMEPLNPKREDSEVSGSEEEEPSEQETSGAESDDRESLFSIPVQPATPHKPPKVGQRKGEKKEVFDIYRVSERMARDLTWGPVQANDGRQAYIPEAGQRD
ncbi:hypothetical protein AMECASPLE_035628, partial [Ameca splendens]